MERDSFIFYTSWLEGLRMLPQEEQVRVKAMLLDYCAFGTEPDMGNISPTAYLAFMYAKPQIDANNRRYMNGRKGGAPRGNQNARKQPENNRETTDGCFKNNLKTTEKQPNVNENVNENENVNIDTPLYPPKGGNDMKKPKSVATDPPTKEEVEAYKAEKGYHFDVEEYMAHYESNGWRVGQNPMKKWKAACVTWEKSWKKREAELKAKAKRYEKPSEIGRIHVDMNPDKYSEGAW